MTTEKLTAKEKDKKKSKSKLKSGKQTKSTAKPAPSAKKGSTNTAPTSQKKALQGLLVLRPASTQGKSNSNSDSNSNSNSRSSSSDAEASKRSSKNDRSDAEDSLQTPLPSLIVGRSSKQNDRITFEIAKEHHLWFHVQVLDIHTFSALSFTFLASDMFYSSLSCSSSLLFSFLFSSLLYCSANDCAVRNIIASHFIVDYTYGA